MYCDTTYTLTKGDSLAITADYRSLQYYTADGTTGNAYSISLAGSGFTSKTTATAVNGIPAKTTYYLRIPSGTSSLPAIVLLGHRINNVIISKTGAPSMTPVAAAPAPRPTIPTPTPNVALTGFNIQLTNCKVNAGVYTCTATLTPR
ncbi:hypothetical protein GCM10008957_24970 [Deinococcus ruber]|uniref:Uncharacterized protein n=1 Tax=Deinococcus ruber TaxID=1848197 RepID=A0A918C800_9DEIO|nr:hypothetical protein GCM10008957_24970 [Deinococcus ruber]